MPDAPLKVTSLRQWHSVKMLPDSKVLEQTQVRFFLDDHGPFELSFPRDVDASEIQRAIQRQRDVLLQLART